MADVPREETSSGLTNNANNVGIIADPTLQEEILARCIPLQPTVCKDWHKVVDYDARVRSMERLVKSKFEEIIEYAKKVEADFFEKLDNKDEYESLIAEKCKDTAEKRRLRQDAAHVASSVPQTQQATAPATDQVESQTDPEERAGEARGAQQSSDNGKVAVEPVQDGPSFQPLPSTIINEWHAAIPENLRTQSVEKLIKTIFPAYNESIPYNDKRIQDLVDYAKRVELDYFEVALHKGEYDFLLAEKCDKMRKDLEGRKMLKAQQRNGPATSHNATVERKEEEGASVSSGHKRPASDGSSQTTSLSNKENEMLRDFTLATPKFHYLALPEESPQPKQWHVQVNAEMRRHMVGSLVLSKFVNLDQTTLQNERVNAFYQYSVKLEADFFNNARDKTEYFNLIWEKIENISAETKTKQEEAKRPREDTSQ